MIRICPKEESGEEERLTPQPKTREIPENERPTMIDQQKIFEDIHERMVYDTIEEKLSNLIDIEAEGENDTKEMSITLEENYV